MASACKRTRRCSGCAGAVRRPRPQLFERRLAPLPAPPASPRRLSQTLIAMAHLKSALLLVVLAAAGASAASSLPEALKGYTALSELAKLLDSVRCAAGGPLQAAVSWLSLGHRRYPLPLGRRRRRRAPAPQPPICLVLRPPACRTPMCTSARASPALCWHPPMRQAAVAQPDGSSRGGSCRQITTAEGPQGSASRDAPLRWPRACPHPPKALQQWAGRPPAQPLLPCPLLTKPPPLAAAPLQAFDALKKAAADGGVKLDDKTLGQILVRRGGCH